MAKWIKNADTLDHTYVGQLIPAGTYYEIQLTEERDWANNSTLLTDIGSGVAVVAKDDSGSNDIVDVALGINYLKDIDNAPVDTDGAPLTRTKLTKTGWHYQCNAVEWTSAKLSSIHNKNRSEADLGYTTIKYYDNTNTELTAGTQTELDNNCVKTVITWEPSQDVEIIGGTLYQSASPSGNIRLWVTAIPDLTVAQGGSVPFCTGGINLKLMGAGAVYTVDGKTPKMMPYNNIYHTSKFEIATIHPVGEQHTIMMVFQLFRENI